MDNSEDTETIEQKAKMGQRMKARREYLKMTQQRVADHLDINRVTYTQYETGENQFPSAKVPRLARFFGVPAAYFFGETESEDLRKREVVQFFEGLPDAIQEVELDHLRALHQAHVKAASRPPVGGKKAE